MQHKIWRKRARNRKEEDAASLAPRIKRAVGIIHTDGITMHQFPTDPVVRAQWVRFVQKHRVDFGEPVNPKGSPFDE